MCIITYHLVWKFIQKDIIIIVISYVPPIYTLDHIASLCKN